MAHDIDAKPPLDGNVVDGAIGKNRTTLKRVLRFAMAIIRLNWVRETSVSLNCLHSGKTKTF